MQNLEGKNPGGCGSLPASAGSTSGPLIAAGCVKAGLDGFMTGAGVVGLLLGSAARWIHEEEKEDAEAGNVTTTCCSTMMVVVGRGEGGGGVTTNASVLPT